MKQETKPLTSQSAVIRPNPLILLLIFLAAAVALIVFLINLMQKDREARLSEVEEGVFFQEVH